LEQPQHGKQCRDPNPGPEQHGRSKFEQVHRDGLQ
jgi:hypothetical protein